MYKRNLLYSEESLEQILEVFDTLHVLNEAYVHGGRAALQREHLQTRHLAVTSLDSWNDSHFWGHIF